MSDRLLRIRIRTVGAESVTRAVRGITQGARAAQRAQQTAERQTTREAQASARAREQTAQREARARAIAAQQAARQQVQAAQRAAREEARAAQATTRAVERERRNQERLAARAARAEASQRRQRWQTAGMVGGALLGGARAAFGRVQGYQAALGMPTRDELIASTLDRQRATIRLAHQSGLSSQDISSRIDAVASRSGVSQASLLQGLSYAQETLASPDFNALDVMSRHLDEIADAAYATGAPVEDLIGALGQMHNQFGITEDQFGEMIGAMVQMAANGSIEVGDLAANFTSEMAQFRQLRSSATGVGAAREFAATAEVIGRQTPGSPEEASTAFRGVMTALGQGRIQRGLEAGLRRGGLSRAESDVFDRNGSLTVSMPELIDRMRRGHLDTSAAFDSAGIRNVRAQAGFRALLQTPGSTYADILSSSSDVGNTMIADTNAELRASTAGQIDRDRAQAEANFQEHAQGTIQAMRDTAAAVTELETRFPALTETMGALSDVISGMGVGGIVGGVGARVAAGGTLAGALGYGGAAAGTGGAAAGGGAIASGIGAVALPAAIVGGTLDFVRGTAGGGFDAEATSASAGSDRLSGGLDAATRGELVRQLGSLSSSQDNQLLTRVHSRLDSGISLTPDAIRQLADAVRRGVADGAPAAPSALSSGSSPSRVPADRRG